MIMSSIAIRHKPDTSFYKNNAYLPVKYKKKMVSQLTHTTIILSTLDKYV